MASSTHKGLEQNNMDPSELKDIHPHNTERENTHKSKFVIHRSAETTGFDS